jgi:hypothetical protein
MINSHSIATNNKQTASAAHVRPDYALYNFANIPGTILNLFNVPTDTRLPEDVLPHSQGFEKVIFFFIDAFGWKLFERFVEDSAVLQQFLNNGVVSQLTSQFPSTTTAHVTTTHTNLPVGGHGMFEWNYYEPAADAVITPLFYSFAGDDTRGTLRGSGLDPAAIYPRSSMYPLLRQHGVASYLFNKAEYAASPYNAAVGAGATRQVAHDDLPQALEQLSQAVIAHEGPAYYFLYWGRFDALCHTYGPDSAQAEEELRCVLQLLESRLLKPLSGARDTLLLIGADHGQTAIDPARTLYLNKLWPDIANTFKTTRGGRPIVPGGSCRSFFLYVKEDRLEQVQGRLQTMLDGTAQVLSVGRLIAQGYFGQPVLQKFLSRVGNLVIVPDPGESVWWYEAGKFEVGWYGFHGGLAAEEMLIPLLALPLGQ